MSAIPSIDLHPDQVRGSGPEAAILACRAFLDRSLKAGFREVRLITGVGMRGDGTPRLRGRIESDVLPGYFRYIEQQAYEQQGAVIHLWLKPTAQKASGTYVKHQRHRDEREKVTHREQRLEVAYQRLELAEDAFEEGDWRRVRLKLNQVAREFGWPLVEGSLDEASAGARLEEDWVRLKKLDGL
jgi:hypothetical protein